MNIIKTAIEGVVILEPRVFNDSRGYFFESFNRKAFEDAVGLVDFVQDNESCSSRGVMRGLHFQRPPHAQAKLVRCVRGSVLDVAVDIRKGSPTYGKYVSCLLTEDNHRQFFIPRGFAHGFVALTDNVEFVYKCDNYYSKECDRSVKFDDPQINVEWGVTEPIISEKDANAPLLKDSDCNFEF